MFDIRAGLLGGGSTPSDLSTLRSVFGDCEHASSAARVFFPRSAERQRLITLRYPNRRKLGADGLGISACRRPLCESARFGGFEYFFPVIWRSFPVIEICFPVIDLVGFGQLGPW